MNLTETELQADHLEEYLQVLIDGIDNLDAAEQELGLDIRNLVSLLDQHPHNDDLHHNGETPLTHIRWVLEDVPKVTTDPEQRRLLGIVALLHDLGKAYTYELIDGKHTFRKHAEVSVKLTKVMLKGLQDSNLAFYQVVEDLVRLHDAFMRLLEAQKGAKDLKYLNKFLRERIYTEGHLDDLLAFSKADGFRAKRFQDTLGGIDDLLQDIRKVEDQRTAEAAAMIRREKTILAKLPDIRSLLETEAPEVMSLLPDMRATNKALGQMNRLDLIKRIQDLISE